MIVSAAAPADLACLLDLERAGFDRPQQWSETAWAAELANPERLVLIGREADQLVAAACFSALAETAELLRVLVAPAWRGQGLARRLVEAGQRWASSVGADRVLLEVRHDNQAALRLYAATGFAPIARRRDYYGPGLDAVVMEARLPAAEMIETGRCR